MMVSDAWMQSIRSGPSPALAGLVASRRDGARMLHLRTPLGEALVGAAL